MYTKADLRPYYLAQRKAVSNARASKVVCEHLLDRLHNYIGGPSTIAVYLAAKEEVNLDFAIELLRLVGHQLTAPRVTGDGTMTFHELDPDDLEIGAFGLRSPKESSPVVEADSMDLMFMPLVAFDDSGNRLGMGGGYYDRYLGMSDAVRFISKIGIAFDCQKSDDIPREKHDTPLDAVVTESGWQLFNDIAIG
ncbi:MAG: 5-formyltetrahydrofolate cyclo-ligase [Pseudomonadaceae bacterium]|nr:5-formyltetrahydrofolate cyclo-ligase [Pseudomonadaceae bacterium]